MRAEFCDEEFAEVGMDPVAEQFPEVFVVKGSVSSDFEFKEMVLGGASQVSTIDKIVRVSAYFRSTA